MKRKILLAAVMLLAVMAVGCANRMTLPDTFIAPQIQGEPDEISYYRVVLSEFLDVTDTALLNNRGVTIPSLSWKAVIFQKTEKPGKYERIELFATRDIFEPRNFLGIKVPDTIKIGPGDYLAVLDHEERLIFNAGGEFIEVDYKSVDPSNHGNFFTKVSDLKKIAYKKGLAEYNKLINFSRSLHAVELSRAADEIRKKLGVPVGSALTQAQLKYVKNKGWDKFFESLLYDNWYVLFSYSLMSPETIGAYIMITKLFQIPTYWLRDENGPGRMRRTMTAADTYFMMKWWKGRDIVVKPATVKAPQTNHPLSDAFKVSLIGTPCENVGTIEDYNLCALEYNRKIQGAAKWERKF